MWVWLTRIPYGILGPTILLLAVLGTYTVRNSLFDVWVSLLFGGLGYLLRKYQWPTAPLLLSFLLGPLLERNLIEALSMSGGSPAIFFVRPIAAVLIATAAVLLAASLLLMRRTVRRIRQVGAEEYEI
jgi:putative tricarboxylic transport membrane protein